MNPTEQNTDQKLLDLIARHRGFDSFTTVCDDTVREDIQALARKIHTAGLGPRSITGLINSEGVAARMGVTVPSSRTERSRMKDFPAPVIDEKLWDEKEVSTYLRERAAKRIGRRGRPPRKGLA
jgi:hypothetical protein